MKVTDEGNRTVIELESPGAYQCFKAGLTDRRQWGRHEETRELSKFVAETGKHNVVVQYAGSNVKIR